jgi:hypothetical protein
MGAALAMLALQISPFLLFHIFLSNLFFIPFPCQGVAMRRLREIKQTEGIEHVQ